MSGHSKTPAALIAAFIAVMLIGGAVMGSKSSKKKPAQGSKPAPAAKAKSSPQSGQSPAFAAAAKGGRAALVRRGTVVVPPCDTPVEATVANALHNTPTPGATVLQLAKPTAVIVPACSGKSGEAQLPSAAIVTTGDAIPPGVKSTITMPADAKTVVLPPCGSQSPAPAGRGGVAVAPTC